VILDDEDHDGPLNQNIRHSSLFNSFKELSMTSPLVTRFILASGLLMTLQIPRAEAIGFFGTYTATLWNTPSQFFTDDDWDLFEHSLRDVLDHHSDGESQAWTNPKSKASGEFTALKSLVRNGKPCREIKIVASAGGMRRVTGIAFCKNEEGAWEAVPGKNQKP
jgi:hypothetical protein